MNQPLTVDDLERTLVLCEMFGPTIQGEGPNLGRQALFVRLSGCHLSCIWCDSRYTWDHKLFDLDAERRLVSVDHILNWVQEHSTELVVITGGEPLLQQLAVTNLARRLKEAAARHVEIETSGTIAPAPELAAVVDAFNVSLKLAHSAMNTRARLRPAAITALVDSGRAVWKFVATGPDDLEEIGSLVRTYGLDPVWVMPEGTSAEAVMDGTRRLADAVVAFGFHFTTRLHILAWGDERGR